MHSGERRSFPEPLRYPPATPANFVKFGAGQANLHEDAAHRYRINVPTMSWDGSPQTQPVVAKSRVVAAFFLPEIKS